MLIVQRRRVVSGYHAEATAWQTRVNSNGGSVSAATMQAVSDFCTAIDAASGLRAAIVRLNLFCGDNMNAALVPLYLATSSGGATVGNSTDTNNNFVSGDYAATGSSGGLTGNGSTKFLGTGVPQNTVSNTNCHLSTSIAEITGFNIVYVGCAFNDPAGLNDLGYINISNPTPGLVTVHRCGSYNANDTYASFSATENHLLGTRTSLTNAVMYRAGTAVSTQTGSQSATFSTAPYSVFASTINASGSSVSAYTPGRMRMYSIGSGINATQAAAFASAVAAFNTALGR